MKHCVSCLIYYIKPKLTIHVILGASEYAKIKTNVAPKVEDPGEPIAGLIVWLEHNVSWSRDQPEPCVTRSSSSDYAQLCSLDVLGLQDRLSL